MAASLGAAAVQAASSTQVGATSQISSAERSGVLPNGLSYRLIQTSDASEPIVLKLHIAAGSGVEDPDQPGVAHFVEHLVANHAFERFPQGSKVLSDNGLPSGSGYNADTGRDATTYSIILPADRRDLVQTGLEVFLGWGSGARFRPADVETQRRVVLAEIALADGTPALLAQGEVARRLSGSGCATEDRDLEKRNVETTTTPVLQRFYDDWYVPARETVVIVGPIDLAQTEGLVRSTLGQMPSAGATRRSVSPVPCIPATEPAVRYQTVSQPGLDTSSLHIAIPLGSPGRPPSARDGVIADLVAHVAAARARSIARRYSPSVTNVRFEIASGRTGRMMLLAIASLRRTEDSLRALAEVMAEAGVLHEAGLTEEELASARVAMAAPAAPSTSRALADFSLPGGEMSYARNSARAALASTVTLADINAWLASSLEPAEADVILATAPQDLAHVPERAAVEQVLGRRGPFVSQTARRPALQHLMTREDLAALAPARQPVVTLDPRSGVTSAVLANGMRALIRPDAGATDHIKLRGVLRGRPAGDGGGRTRAALEIAANGGVAEFNKFELADYLAARSVNFSMALVRDGLSMEGSAPAPEFETLLQTAYLSLTAPRWTAESLKDWQESNALAATRGGENGAAELQQIENAHFWNGDLEHGGGDAELDLGSARATFEDFKGGLGGLTLVVTGALDPDNTVSLLNRYFGALKVRADAVWRPVEQPVVQTRELHRTLGPAGSSALVRISIPGRMPDNLKARLELELLGAVLNERIYSRIRMREGGAYAARASVYALAGGIGPSSAYVFAIRFDCASEQAEPMRRAAIEEVERLRTTGPDDGELARALVSVRRRPQISMPRSWEDYLVDNTESETFVYDPSIRQAELERIDLDDLRAAALRYFDLSSTLEIVQVPAA